MWARCFISPRTSGGWCSRWAARSAGLCARSPRPTNAGPSDGLNGTGSYVHWGFVQLSVANLVVIGLMVIVFILALTLPFPGSKDRR